MKKGSHHSPSANAKNKIWHTGRKLTPVFIKIKKWHLKLGIRIPCVGEEFYINGSR